MERKKCTDLNNSEIREYVMSLENEYEAKKAKIKLMCEELIEIENAYNEAQNEIKIRKTVF